MTTEYDDDNRPLSEVYRVAHEAWCDLENAAQLLEDMKSVVLNQRKNEFGDIADNKAERMVKASPEWEQYVRDCVEARTKANKAKGQLEVIKMRFNERQNMDANHRAELRHL